MPTLRKTLKVDATPDEAWAILGDLAAVDSWIPGIVGAQVDGTTRLCATADGGEVREEISDYSAEGRSYRYAHTHTPLPVRDSQGRLAVALDGDGTVIVWEAAFEALDPAQEADLTRMLDGVFDQTLASLGRQIEAAR